MLPFGKLRALRQCQFKNVYTERAFDLAQAKAKRVEVCPQKESNLHLSLRRATLYPLSYGDVVDVLFLA